MLADSASAHQDGTTSMLRAGIDRVQGPAAPFVLRAALVVRIQGDIGDVGQHDFDLKCLDIDGTEVMPRLDGQFTIERGGGATFLVLTMQAPFQRPGSYVFVLRVDRVQLGDWNLNVVQTTA